MDQKFREKAGKKKVVVVGTIFLDIKGYPEGDFFPTACNPGRIEYKHGGVARNVAEDVAALGFNPVFLSIADESGAGESVLKWLDEAGVNTKYILRHENGIGTWLVILNERGDICANLSKRQDLTPLCRMLEEKGDEIFRDADGIMLEMDVAEPVVKAVFDYAEKYRVDVYGVISDMPIARERLSYIQKTRCFICNRQEAGFLFETDTAGKTPEQMLKLLREKRESFSVPCMVITMDKDGAVYANAEQEGYCPAIETKVEDSTGAGDSFFAGTAAAQICGYDMESALLLGTRMASEVISSGENVYRPARED